ncbi:MAG TPA: large-conductance mechanosensitive channel protein MscL [Desulfobacteraceae bacterium]|nr:large-conductance mechanosensitive channel protein MscL [Desulfobacteraceae bacterium]
MLQEFKQFVKRGNVIDLAVAVIIGGAFGKIIASLVENIIMPFIGILMGGVSFEELQVVVGEAVLTYGLFIQSIIDFLIIAFVIFMFIKAINSSKKKEEEAAAPPAPSSKEVLLTEIRDILKENMREAG